MRALVVDDSRFLRDYLCGLLTGWGVVCSSAENGEQGLRILADAGPFDVALIDWNMPVLGGLEMVRSLRSDRRWNGMKILMVTTESENGFIAAALAAGADEYLMKPFDEEGLVEKLQLVGLLTDGAK
ncbi:response regulator [Silvibacterium acidisoli]|uniref:response regulator n=1 Tax=Acidobacteriaceae bacterium ZG23-2 TaxID=2883246 RepID=UPI00406CCA78